ncbi:A/G-specific adenine glycosylase [Streptococcus constellatus]|uniref:Adenine DNA glycosylase n=1 Tax=Streptococcus constellatus subsp. constellatus SK53 TaxID=1095730 RepID=A0AAD2SV90_STRCV|nr:A/G-specific adenine glycosylase [Streptococcus constellatus]EID18923.1 A/G-specific adenine glycosylase [Streptococcus constellatus subsp. constellatus SK53]MDP1485045.1 A/G-specific adenine glycosylase [Streptococcus constellatus]QQT05800.1 A/G-specific adenine glycosylase [Streptococcus constellatus]BBD22426.1 A/G-specific adenine glycosylase [Streptococcus constellatus subsp. constellatus]GAD38295.1 A/G-specific DNA glycosylase [Streptococcus constellatus subsp. constellatus SK53]
MLDLKKYGIEMWEDEKITSFRQKLLTWYDENKRDLPWRRSNNPYHIWISEIMLQQTRVDTVIPYYERFLDWFPTVQDLAIAPEERLLKAWEGLGYYSRVRNMQEAAQQIVAEFEGEFPHTYEGIFSLKGIGPYTAGAIASIAFGLPEPAVDGNVMRVLSRLFEVNLDIGIPANRKVFQTMMEMLIDSERPGDFNQALMDLGSDIEAPVNPRPEDSPVKEFSAAFLHGTMEKYPIKAPKKKPVPVYLYGLIIQDAQGQFLLEKNETSGLLAGFWHFPLIEVGEFPDDEQLSLFEIAENQVSFDLSPKESFEQDYDVVVDWQSVHFPQIQHVFSHRKWQIRLLYGQVVNATEMPKQEQVLWLHPDEFDNYPFAKPQQKMWQAFQKGKLKGN